MANEKNEGSTFDFDKIVEGIFNGDDLDVQTKLEKIKSRLNFMKKMQETVDKGMESVRLKIFDVVFARKEIEIIFQVSCEQGETNIIIGFGDELREKVTQ